MMVIVSRLYKTEAAAHHVANELLAQGLPEDDLGIISPHGKGHPMVNAPAAAEGDKIDRDGDGKDDRTEATEEGAGVGAVVGGVAGLLAGLGIFAIPGVGPVIAAGWLAAMVGGAVAGGAAGGIIGALTKAGIDPNKAEIYAEAVRRGGTLVTIRVGEEDVGLYRKVLDETAMNEDALKDTYKAEGWQGFDPAGMPIQLRDIQPYNASR